MADDWDDDDCDDAFLAAVDQLEAHRSGTTQQATLHPRASQPSSPLPPPPAAQQQQPPPGAGLPPGPGLYPQQQHQHQVPAAPLQQLNGNGSGGQISAHVHKPPLPASRPTSAHHQPQHHPPHQRAVPHAQAYGPGMPVGHITLAANELQAQAAAAPPPAQQQQQQQQQWQGHAVGTPAGGHSHAQLSQLQNDLVRSQSENTFLHSNLKQKENELASLRQRLKQLERSAGSAAAAAGGSGGSNMGAAHQHQHQQRFAVGELQKQLDSLKQQMLFKEQEMDDLKRQHAERTERLKAAESAVTELQRKLQESAAAAGQQQQQANGVAAGAPGAAAAVPAGARVGQQHERPGSAGRTASAASAQRSGGQKRRQGADDPECAAAAAADADAASGATDGTAPSSAAAAAAAGPSAPAAAPAAPPPPLPLLHPGVLAAASSLTSSTHLISRLMAAASGSMALLVGAVPQAYTPAAAAEGEGAPTALLLRERLAAAAGQVADPASMHFTSAFSQRLQQVACGMVPPAALLDSIGALLAASLVQLAQQGGIAGAAGSAGLAGAAGSTQQLQGHLPLHHVQLLAAALHVAQQLIELDTGCAAAALAAPGSVRGTVSRQNSRISFHTRSSSPAVPAPAALPAMPGIAWQGGTGRSSTGSCTAGLPATASLVQQHAAVLGGLACGDSILLPLVLAAALWLGQGHEAVAAGALGCLVALARALQGEGRRAPLAPVFTTGAMELFLQPAALRLQALRLLQLLLEEPCLAHLFEGSLAQAAATRGEPGPPTATAGTSGGGGDGLTGSGTPGGPGGAAAAGEGDGAEAMQVEGGEGSGGNGPWMGAAAIAEKLLDCLILDDGGPPACSSLGGTMLQDAGGAAAAGVTASTTAAAAAAVEAEAGCPGLSGSGGAAVARAAMQLVAALREARQHGILVSLLLDDAFGAPGCMLAQRLVQLADAALALPGEAGALMLLCPLQWPRSDSDGGGGGSSNSGPVLCQQAVWWQRVRVAQEALTLLRALLVDDSCGVAAMDDLVTIPGTARLTLTTLSRLSRLEAPPTPPAAGSRPAAGAAAAVCLPTGPPPAAAMLAPWARAIGSSTDRPSLGDTAGSGSGGAPPPSGTLPSCSTEDVVYMAKSMRRRVLAHMQSGTMQA